MSNGFNTAFIAPGGPGYVPYAPPALAPPVYTGTDPTIFSTDQPALIPPQVEVPLQAEPVWYDPQAPLDFTGMNFADDPVSPPPISSSPVTYNWQAPLYPGGTSYPSAPVSYIPEFVSEGLVFPSGPVSAAPMIYEPPGSSSAEPVWFDWQAPLVTEGLNFPSGAPTVPGIIEGRDIATGPLESIGQFVGDVFGKIVEVGKFILDKVDIGVSYKGEFGGVKTQAAYYKTLGAPATTILGIPGGAAPSVRTSVSTSGGAGGPPMTEDERLYREAMGQTEADTTKFMMYAAGIFLGYKLLTKKS